MRRFLIKTFGCQMNKDDSERIAGLLIREGHESAAGEADADMIIFNTCCVRQNADEKLYGQVGALKPLKSEKPDLLIAVGGCLAQKDGRTLQTRFPHIDIVFGTHNVGRLSEMIEEVTSSRQPGYEILSETDGFTGDLPSSRQHKWHAWLPIMVGCDNYCSYCIVPYVRGREKSRLLETLVEKCGALVEDGVREITLLGQNVNSYGRDLYGRPRLDELLEQVSGINGLNRIRFTTSHPKDLSERIIDQVAEKDNVCSHFHLPLQSGSDRVLKAMRRQYSSRRYLEIVKKIRTRVDNVAITTDIMVGFPGETEEDFQATLDVVKAAHFDQAFTFIYSPRVGTKALELGDQVDKEVVAARFKRLLETQNKNSFASNKRLVGRKLPVFIEGISKKSGYRLAARTDSNKLVHIEGGDELIGKILNVKIKKAFSWFLIGEVVETV